MKFPKPSFAKLVDNYQTNPASVHDCPRIYQKDAERERASVNTCAIRMSEALVIANDLITDRTAIGQLDQGPNRRDPHLLALYEYKNNLCPHGIARGARDLAYFLHEQWGKPTKAWDRPGKDAPKDALEMTGIVAFIKLLDFPDVSGHVDVWDKNHAHGHAYWNAEKVWLWRME